MDIYGPYLYNLLQLVPHYPHCFVMFPQLGSHSYEMLIYGLGSQLISLDRASAPPRLGPLGALHGFLKPFHAIPCHSSGLKWLEQK